MAHESGLLAAVSNAVVPKRPKLDAEGFEIVEPSKKKRKYASTPMFNDSLHTGVTHRGGQHSDPHINGGSFAGLYSADAERGAFLYGSTSNPAEIKKHIHYNVCSLFCKHEGQAIERTLLFLVQPIRKGETSTFKHISYLAG